MTRLRIFIVAATFKIVRIASALRPCFPITFQKSALATRSSKIELISPSISETFTRPGWSTKALAMVSISSFSTISP